MDQQQWWKIERPKYSLGIHLNELIHVSLCALMSSDLVATV